MSEDVDEQLKLVHMLVDVVERANKKSCVILLRFNVDKPKSSYAQAKLFAWRKEDEEIQQIVYLN